MEPTAQLRLGQVPPELIFLAPARLENDRALGGLAVLNDLPGLCRGKKADVSHGEAAGKKRSEGE